jgi:hypothetical protein
MVDMAIRGALTSASTLFFRDGSTAPLVIIGAVTYQILTPNNLLIESGIAEQDQTNAARWLISFTVPHTAPITSNGQKYQLKWRAASGNEIVTNNEYFQVVDTAAPDPIDTSIVTLVGNPFRANLITPDAGLKSLSLRVLTAEGTPIISLANLITDPPEGASPPGPISPVVSGSNSVYSIPIDENYGLAGLTMRHSGLANYFAYFNYTDSVGQQLTEIQPIYLANTLVVSMMNDMRQFTDLLRNNDAVVELRVSEAKLLHFAVQGLLRVNATSPANFVFDFVMLARVAQFYFWVLKAAQYELLSALYLAEGMTAFDFQGMSVQLNMDRTQFIQSLMNDIKSDLDNNLPKVKSQYARSGGFTGRIGTIGGVISPSFNWVFRASYGSMNWGGSLPVLPFLY